MKRTKVYDLVKEILIAHKSTRNSDQELIYKVWQQQGFGKHTWGQDHGVSFDDYEQFMDAAHPKTIIENRRKLQRDQEKKIRKGVFVSEHELLIADKEVLDLRQQLADQRGSHTYRQEVTLFD